VVTDGGARRLLAVDVGNTNTVLGLYEGSELLRHWRLTSRRDMTSDEIALSVEGLLRAVPGSRPPDDVIVATVVPSLRFPMRQAFRQLFDKDPVFVEPGIKTGMPILYESPSEVGADRIVNAVAAFAKVSGPCIVVDFGTATTFDVVTARGEYAGGVIVPGISISAEALFEKAARLWRVARTAIDGDGNWNEGLLALTRLAELRSAAYADSARRWRTKIENAPGNPFPRNPGLTPDDILPSLQAIVLERRRAVVGDSAVLADILSRLESKNYDHGDAWVLGRLGAGAKDSLWARFRSAGTDEYRVRYLTLLSYFTDPGLIPFLAHVYVAPDSFGLIKRYAIRASDGLLWIGTRESMQALLDARAVARARGIYDAPDLRHADLDFLGSDSSSVISRTGKWLTDWIQELPAAGPAESVGPSHAESKSP